MDRAFLIGVRRYPDYHLKGVSNDLALLAHALEHRNYPRAAIEIFDDSHTTYHELQRVLAQIATAYTNVTHGSCYIHVSASGAIWDEPLMGGVVPSDGDVQDWSNIVTFAALNGYLPLHDQIRVTVTLDT